MEHPDNLSLGDELIIKFSKGFKIVRFEQHLNQSSFKILIITETVKIHWYSPDLNKSIEYLTSNKIYEIKD